MPRITRGSRQTAAPTILWIAAALALGSAAVGCERDGGSGGDAATKTAASTTSGPVAIGSEPLEVGTRMVVTETIDTRGKIRMAMAGKTSEAPLQDLEREKLEIVVRADEEGKRRPVVVEFVESEKVSMARPEEGGEPREKRVERPYAGESFLFYRPTEGDELRVETMGGQPAEISADVREHLRQFHIYDPPAISTWLAGQTFRRGEEVDVPPKIFRELMKNPDSDQEQTISVESATLTLDEVERRDGARVAVFSIGGKMTTTLQQPENRMKIQLAMDLGGTYAVEVRTGHLSSLHIEAPFELSAIGVPKGSPVRIAGSGRVVMDRSVDEIDKKSK